VVIVVDGVRQIGILEITRRGRPVAPVVVARPRDSQDPACHRDFVAVNGKLVDQRNTREDVLLREERARAFEDLDIHRLDPVLTAKRDQVGPLVAREPFLATGIDYVVDREPSTKTGLADPEVLGDLGNARSRLPNSIDCPASKTRRVCAGITELLPAAMSVQNRCPGYRVGLRWSLTAGGLWRRQAATIAVSVAPPKRAIRQAPRDRRLRSGSRFRRSAATFQQRHAFDVRGHREDADAAERDRDPLPMTACISSI
jgi:hypothetical protein